MPIGLIAGNGTFPFLILRAARQLGHQVAVVAIEGETFPALEALAAELGGATVEWVKLGQLGKCIAALTGAGVTQAVMAGQVKHVKLFSDVMPDLTLLSVLGRLRSKNTDALIAAVAEALERHGIQLMDSTALLADLLAAPGVLTRRAPTEAMARDFAFGYGVADVVAGLDVGKMDRLPDATGMKDEVVVQRGHRNAYDHAIRAAGIRFVEVGYLGYPGAGGTFVEQGLCLAPGECLAQ